MPLAREAVEQDRVMGIWGLHALVLTVLGEVYLAARLTDQALAWGERALDLARTRREPGHETYALRLLGEIGAVIEPPGVEQAEGHYCRALTLATDLGMRPLAAHCHLGLGQLFRRAGREAPAREHLAAAAALYREMDMAFWLARAEAAMAR